MHSVLQSGTTYYVSKVDAAYSCSIWLIIHCACSLHISKPFSTLLCNKGLSMLSLEFSLLTDEWAIKNKNNMITTSNNVNVVWFLTICYINGLLKWVKLGRWSLLTIHTQFFVALFKCTSASLNFYNSSFLISVCFPVHMHSLLDFNNCNNICPALI